MPRCAVWRVWVRKLDQADLLVTGSVGDLPGRKVADLFENLDLLRNHSLGLRRLHREGIDTEDGPAAIIDLITAYRAAA